MYPARFPRPKPVHPAIIELERNVARWLPDQLAKHPRPIARALHKRWRETKAEQGRAAANIEVREFTESTRYMLPPNGGEETVRTWAARRARQVWQAIHRAGNEPEADRNEKDWQRAYITAAKIVRRHSLSPPDPLRNVTLRGAVRRMCCKRWWRRQARTVFMRQAERNARGLGLVHKHGCPYLSDDTFKRWCERQTLNAQTLGDTLAVSDAGEAKPLDEIVAHSIANPRVRRSELMTRIAGMEEYAESRGCGALFVTLTAPGDMHAVGSEDQRRLPGADLSPREIHQWLSDRWKCIRAALARHEIRYFGIRIAEPHLDGTPHWHLLVFLPWHHRDPFERTIKAYVLGDTPNQARRKYGVDITRIDRSRGSATGYVAKYVAKAIDAHGVDGVKSVDAKGREEWADTEAASAAARVRAWASTWGIRQFQFFGMPSVTLWRELRRLAPLYVGDPLEPIRKAADEGDWTRYVKAMGGAFCAGKDRPAYVTYTRSGRLGEYGEETFTPVIRCGGKEYRSRAESWDLIYVPGLAVAMGLKEPAPPDNWQALKRERSSEKHRIAVWEAQRSGEAASTWSSVNNCTQT